MRRRVRLLVLVLFVVVSCIDQKQYQINSVSVNPSMAVPIAFGNLTIQDLLKKSDSINIKIDTGDVVYLEYSKQLISQDIRNLVDIPDKTINRSFVLPVGTIAAHNTKDIRKDSLNNLMDLGLSPEQLSQIDFSMGTISYSATWLPSSPTPPPFEVLLTSSDFVSRTTGKTLSLVANGVGTLPLSDYVLNMNKNKFNLKMVLVLKKTSSSFNVKPNSSVAVSFSMLGMNFNTIQGFFGDQTAFPPADSVDIGVFGKSLINANISFAQPAITLSVVSDYGIPCKVTFSKFEARKNGTTLPIQISPASPVTITAPGVLGTSATTLVSVTNTKAVMNFAPNQIYYKTKARINQGLISGNNFMADTSKMRVFLGLNVPIYGQASGIVLRDTAQDLGLEKMDRSQVKTASLKINAINQLPLDANIQIYLTDANNLVLDSLFDNSQTNLIKGSTVSANGDLLTSGVMDKMISLSSDRVNKIFSATKLIIVAVLNTSKDASGTTIDVKFKSKYTLKVNAGLLVDMNFNVKL